MLLNSDDSLRLRVGRSIGKMLREAGLEVTVLGNEDRILLVARFDNLGKGASGAAVECMNISLGKDPTTGLEV